MMPTKTPTQQRVSSPAVTAKLTDAMVVVVDDVDGVTVAASLAQVRTALLLALTLTGPVTGTVGIGTASSLTTTLTDQAVTLAKMANLATQRLLGRATAGTGIPEAIAIGNGLTLSAGTLSASAQTGVAPSATLLTSRAFGGF